jgi:hypothetical protein
MNAPGNSLWLVGIVSQFSVPICRKLSPIPNGSIEENAMEIRLFEDLNLGPAVPPNTWINGTLPVPPGNWRVASLIAVASIEPGNLVTRDVDTMVSLNQQERLKATENGTPSPSFRAGN